MSAERVSPGKWRHALLKSDLPPRALLVAHTLGTYMDNDGVSHAGTRALAEGSNQNRRTVAKFLKMLVAEGYVLEDEHKVGRVQYRYATVPTGASQEYTTQGGASQEYTAPPHEVVHSEGVGGAFSTPSGASQERALTPRTPEISNRDSEIQFKPCPPHSMVRLKPGPDGEYCSNPKCHLSVPQRMKASRVADVVVKDIA